MFASIVLSVGAAFFILTSLSALARPTQFAGLLGLTLPGADGVNEVRAQYGGFFLIAGLAVAAALAGQVPRDWGLVILAVTFGGLIAGRLMALLAEHSFARYGTMIRALFLIDSCGFLVSIAALLTHGQQV
jgi:hypothetical protein